jgi:hypothetical protein
MQFGTKEVKSIQKLFQKEIANRGSLIVPFNNEVLPSILFVTLTYILG